MCEGLSRGCLLGREETVVRLSTDFLDVGHERG